MFDVKVLDDTNTPLYTLFAEKATMVSLTTSKIDVTLMASNHGHGEESINIIINGALIANGVVGMVNNDTA